MLWVLSHNRKTKYPVMRSMETLTRMINQRGLLRYEGKETSLSLLQNGCNDKEDTSLRIQQ